MALESIEKYILLLLAQRGLILNTKQKTGDIGGILLHNTHTHTHTHTHKTPKNKKKHKKYNQIKDKPTYRKLKKPHKLYTTTKCVLLSNIRKEQTKRKVGKLYEQIIHKKGNTNDS